MEQGAPVQRTGDVAMSIGITLAELDRRTRAVLSEAAVEFFTTQNVIDWLNEAQDVISADAPFTAVTVWTMPAVPNVPSYLLPTEMIAPVSTSMRDASGRVYRITYIEADLLDQQRSWSTGISGRPRLCTYRMAEDGVALDIWPGPNDSPLDIYVGGYLRPATLTEQTDRSDIPPWLSQTVIKYALYRAKVKDEEQGEADRAYADFQRDLDRLAERRLLIQYDQLNAVRDYRAVGGYRWPYS